LFRKFRQRDDVATAKLSAAADRLANVAAREVQLQYARFSQDRAAEVDAGRERARADSIRCAQHQQKYDAAFAPFNKKAPPPASDAHPGTYRRELFREGQRLLPSTSDLAAITAARIDSSASFRLRKSCSANCNKRLLPRAMRTARTAVMTQERCE
jgi:hypothetical protein